MKKMTKAMLMTALICGTMYCGAEPVQANELNTFALDEYVVTATRTPVKVFDANANISVITREEIENAHYDNLESALRTVPGVNIHNYGLAGYNGSLRINGAKNVIVLIDGVRANHPTQDGFPASYLNIDNVEQIEILKGSASALYGADAKGGVINIITKKAIANKTNVTIAGGNFGTEQYKLHNEGKEKTWSYSIDVAKERQGDIKDGKGKTWENKYDSENVNLQVRKELGDDSDLTIGYDYHQYDWKYENIPGRNSEITFGDSESESYYAIWNQKLDETLKNTFSVRNSEYKWWDYNWKYGNNYESLSVSDYLTKKFDEKHTVTLGFDYSSSEDKVSAKTKYAKVYSRAIYLQDEWNFDKKWNLTSGVRYDSHSFAGDNTSARFNLGHKFNEKTNMYMSYSEFFVAPTISQYADIKYGNWDLEAEDGHNYELGVNHKFDNSTALTAHIFKRKTDKLIGYNSTTQRQDNFDEDAKGFDVQLSKAFNNHLSSYVGYTYTHFESDYMGDNWNGLFPRHTINVGVDYSDRKFNALINARAALERGKGIGAAADMLPDYNYVIVDLATNYKPTSNIKLFAKVNNLFDKYYCENTDGNQGQWAIPGEGGWYAMPGRTILVGMEYSF